jgi:CDP-glucose 4,6-dehydratase
MSKIKKLSNFWKNKKVFITGHTGFKGTWLCIFLDILGAKVYGYSNHEKISSFFYKKANIKKVIQKSINGDIRDYKKLKASINKIKPQVLIHFAAQSLVRKSYMDPVTTYDVNIMGTVNILNIVNEIKTIKSSLIITTDKVYHNDNKKKLFKENDKLGGNDPYGNSKSCADFIANFYISNFYKNKKSVAIVRSGNIIGGGDYAQDRIIPDFIRALKKNRSLKIRIPRAIRPWQHVMEPLYGYLLLAEKLYKSRNTNLSGAWNFGPNKKNNETVIKMIRRLNCNFNNKVRIIINKKPNQLYESKILMLNSEKAKKQLSWNSLISLSNAIKLTYEWYERAINSKDYLNITRNQIVNYLKKIN